MKSEFEEVKRAHDKILKAANVAALWATLACY
jgi:hypothetical protein